MNISVSEQISDEIVRYVSNFGVKPRNIYLGMSEVERIYKIRYYNEHGERIDNVLIKTGKFMGLNVFNVDAESHISFSQ